MVHHENDERMSADKQKENEMKAMMRDAIPGSACRMEERGQEQKERTRQTEAERPLEKDADDEEEERQ